MRNLEILAKPKLESPRKDSNSNVVVNAPYFDGLTHRIKGADGLPWCSPSQVQAKSVFSWMKGANVADSEKLQRVQFKSTWLTTTQADHTAANASVPSVESDFTPTL